MKKATTRVEEIPQNTGSRKRRKRVLPTSGAGDPPGEPVCAVCGSDFEAHTAKTATCTVCTRYRSIVSNAKKTRRDGKAPGVSMTLTEFASWMKGRARRCEYCHIHEEQLVLLGMKTQVGLPLQRLGVDRVNDKEGYTTKNIVWCCFGCNKAKSNTFTHQEMLKVGESVRVVWEARLAKAGFIK